MDHDKTTCSVKDILRRIFRKKKSISTGTNTTEYTQGGNDERTNTRRTTVRITRIRGTFERIPRRRTPTRNIRHLARENSLAQYLGYTGGEVVIMNRTKVAIMTDNQVREFLREDVSGTDSDSSEFDPFMEASASCPIAEESFDSGLLKMTTPWFMAYPM